MKENLVHRLMYPESRAVLTETDFIPSTLLFPVSNIPQIPRTYTIFVQLPSTLYNVNKLERC